MAKEFINKEDFLLAEDHNICYPTKYRIDIDKFDSLPTLDVDKMMNEIYMAGVNMADEYHGYHGCWVRFKDINKIVNKYLKGEENV